MTTVFAWLAVALGALGGMLAAMTLVGRLLPRQHVSSRTITLPVSPDVVWRTVVDDPGQLSPPRSPQLAASPSPNKARSPTRSFGL